MIITIIAISIIALAVLFGVYNDLRICSMMIDHIDSINAILNKYEKSLKIAIENNNLSNIENLRNEYCFLRNKLDLFACIFNLSLIYVKGVTSTLHLHNEKSIAKNPLSDFRKNNLLDYNKTTIEKIKNELNETPPWIRSSFIRFVRKLRIK